MEQRPGIRIGDRERREVDERLRAAHEEGMLTLSEYDERSQACWAARFRGDLDALVTDLPDEQPTRSPAHAPTVHETVPDTTSDDDSPSWSERVKSWGGNLVGLAIAGALAFTVLGADDGVAVFGERTVAIGPGQTEAQVGVLFGSARVVVPEGVQATTSGLTVFGSTGCRAACATPSPNGAQVDVSARGAFGSVEVLTPAEAAAGGDLDDD